MILKSQAVLIGNKEALQQRPEVLAVAHMLLELTEAYQRAQRSFHGHGQHARRIAGGRGAQDV